MATNTTNYGLTKPAGTDKYDISVQNANMDKIDAQMKANADGLVEAGKIYETKANAITGLSASGTTITYTKGDGNTGTITTKDTTYEAVTQSANGLMTANDKKKLDGIELGAQKNTVTGVKGSDESAYRTGNVSISPANIGLGNVNNTSDADKPISTATQSALSGKQATITGAATTITDNNLTANRVLISNNSGKVTVSEVTSAELGYLDGITSNVQSQLDGKSANGHTHDNRYYTESEIDSLLSNKAGVSVATTSANGLMSSSDKTKLNGIDSGANKTVVDNALSDTSVNPVQNKVVTSALKGKQATLSAGTNISIVDNVISAVDTKYVVATQSANGLMSSADKTKLDGIDKTKLDGISESADAVSFTRSLTSGTKIGTITINGTDTHLYCNPPTTVDDALSKDSTNPVQNKVINSALSGKQNNITGGATSIVSNNLTASRVLVSDGSGKVSVSAVTSTELGYLDGVTSNVQTQLNSKAGNSVATTSANGLMSSGDKSKLDGIASGANKTVVDSALSDTSTNPVQNKVINSALANKVTAEWVLSNTQRKITYGTGNPPSGGQAGDIYIKY